MSDITGKVAATLRVGETVLAADVVAGRDAPLCPGCEIPARWGGTDTGGHDVIECDQCRRRIAAGLV
ncbi:hypothetical protein [Microcystis phage Mwe-JY05]